MPDVIRQYDSEVSEGELYLGHSNRYTKHTVSYAFIPESVEAQLEGGNTLVFKFQYPIPEEAGNENEPANGCTITLGKFTGKLLEVKARLIPLDSLNTRLGEVADSLRSIEHSLPNNHQFSRSVKVNHTIAAKFFDRMSGKLQQDILSYYRMHVQNDR